MTKERYESLALADLKAIAKNRGMKGVSTLKKADLIEAMIKQDEKEALEARALRREQWQEQRGEMRYGEQEPPFEQRQNTRGGEQEPRFEQRQNGRGEQETRFEQRQNGRGEQETRFEQRQNGRGGEQEPRFEQRQNGRGEQQDARFDQRANSRTEGRYEQRQNRYENGGQENRGEQRTPYYYGGQSVQRRQNSRTAVRPDTPILHKDEMPAELDSGQLANGILEVMPDGFGFIRCANYMPGENDVYVAPSQIRRFNLKTGDILVGNIRIKTQSEKFSALLFVKSINGLPPEEATKRYNFEDMTPVFPDERIRLERQGGSISMRVMDLMSPVGKGQRGMIVSPPKAGKTTLLKQVAKSVTLNSPELHLIILLIDERPEEVTDIKEAIEGPNVEVIYSTFDELPEHHKRVSEMVIERAKRLVEHKKDVMILLDSITRLTRAYNLTEPSSGRTLSGGLDPAALHMPKRFFGAARNMREGGSLTILATALIDTGSRMDEVIYEEFKGTGNMEMVLDRKLSERRIFPAIDIQRSGTRRDDLLLTPDELESINTIRKAFNSMKSDEAVDRVLDLFSKTRTNGEFVNMVKKINWNL